MLHDRRLQNEIPIESDTSREVQTLWKLLHKLYCAAAELTPESVNSSIESSSSSLLGRLIGDSLCLTLTSQNLSVPSGRVEVVDSILHKLFHAHVSRICLRHRHHISPVLDSFGVVWLASLAVLTGQSLACHIVGG